MIEAFFVSEEEKVFANKKPIEFHGKIFAFQGERASIQLVLKYDKAENGMPYTNCMLAVDSPIKKHIHIERVGNVPCTFPIPDIADDYVLTNESGLFPDVLEAVNNENITLSPSVYHSFLFTVDNRAIESGEYQVKIQVKIGQETFSREFTFYSLKTKLETSEVIYTNWFHYDSIQVQHNVRFWNKRYKKIFREYLKFAVRAGQNMLLTPVFTPQIDVDKGQYRKSSQLVNITFEYDRYFFDFSRLEEFIDIAKQEGTVYFEIPPLFSQWGAEYAVAFYLKENGKQKRAFGWKTKALSDEYRKFLKIFLYELKGFLERKGIYQNCFFHISDEPNEKQFEQYKACYLFVKENLSDARILDALSDVEYIDKTNGNYYPVAHLKSAAKFQEERIKHFSVYNCCGPVDEYYSNRFLDFPLDRISVLGIQAYLNNVELYLHWGYNFYGSFHSRKQINPYFVTDCEGAYSAGDPFIVYPDYANDGCNGSVRLNAVYRGWVFFKVLKTLEKMYSRDFVKNFLTERGFSGFCVYPRERGFLRKLLEQMIKLIEK